MSIPLTIRTRRGLLDVLDLVRQSQDPSTPPGYTVVARYSNPRKQDLEIAMRYLAQITKDAQLERDVAAARKLEKEIATALKKPGRLADPNLILKG